jgi:hypothetical protein
VVDVHWYDKDGRRKSTSFLADTEPVRAVRRAIERREKALGISYNVSAREAWEKMKVSKP